MRVGPKSFTSGIASGIQTLGGGIVVAGGRTLVMMIGQSNAESHDLVSNLSASNAQYANAYANVPYMSKQDWTFGDNPLVWVEQTITTLRSTSFGPTGGAPVPCVGFEVTMMRDLDIARPNGFALGRIAVGGSKSTHWDPAAVAPLDPGGANMFNTMVTYTRSCMTSMGCSQVIFVWEQGEADAKSTTDGTAYAAWLLTFIDALRVQFPNAPFVYGKLNADATAATYLGLSQLRASQVTDSTARSNLTLVSQDSITVASGLYDGTHYTADGYCSVGHLFSPAVAAYAGIRIQPVASFTYVPTGLSVAFTDASVSYGDTITGYDWDWGDGTAHGTTANPSHTYAAGGTYNVVERVTNSHGDSNSTTTAVSVISGIAGVTRDAGSSIYAPASATEWGTFLTAISSAMSAPDALYLLQEASGNPADSIGSIPLTAVNTPAYQQSVTGWTRKAISMTDGTAKALSSTAAGLPDISTTSMMTMAFVAMPAAAPAVDRNIIEQGTSASTRNSLILKTTGHPQETSTSANTATGTGSPLNGVYPMVTKVNRTGTACVGYTDVDKMTPTFGATMTGKALYLGAQSGGLSAAAAGYLYVAVWFGAHAEVTDAQVKALLQGLGFTITWT